MTILVPREHGAYGQLILPMVTGMAIGRPSHAAYMLAAAAAAVFLGHEPMIVLIGGRGARAQRERRRDAWRTLILSASGALVLGAAAIALMPATSRWTVAPPIALALLVGILVARGRERTTSGEIVVAAAFASVAFPVAFASTTSPLAALTCAVAFATSFAAATVSVRAVIARTHGGGVGGARVAALATAILLLSIGAALAAFRIVLPAAPWAAAPMCAVAVGVAIAAPPPRYLRQIGWALAAASTLTGVILVSAIR
jgi:hypothetical protein